MPRLFTGFSLPAALARELTLLRGGLSGARWVEPDDFHITLRFIGDVGETEANEVHSALERIRRAPVTLTVSTLDVFGGAKPRALVASVRASLALAELQAEQERLMRRIGLPAETRKFTPHVTLARLRQTSPEAVAAFLSTRGYIEPRTFEADHFALFSARDSVGGGPYVVEAVYPLQ
jgi:RNA 2',3'-cyclic 3'-phosphodiesterase